LFLRMADGSSWESRLSVKSPSLARFLIANAKVWQQWPSPLRNELLSAPFVSWNGGLDMLGEQAHREISIIGTVPGCQCQSLATVAFSTQKSIEEHPFVSWNGSWDMLGEQTQREIFIIGTVPGCQCQSLATVAFSTQKSTEEFPLCFSEWRMGHVGRAGSS